MATLWIPTLEAQQAKPFISADMIAYKAKITIQNLSSQKHLHFYNPKITHQCWRKFTSVLWRIVMSMKVQTKS